MCFQSNNCVCVLRFSTCFRGYNVVCSHVVITHTGIIIKVQSKLVFNKYANFLVKISH